jgi:hypothetical protein
MIKNLNILYFTKENIYTLNEENFLFLYINTFF